MTEAETLEPLTDVVRNEFDDDNLVPTRRTAAQDSDGWDSQAHVSLMVAAGVRFRTAKVESTRNVDGLVELIRTENSDASMP